MTTPSVHAYLSASGAHRWINCPPLRALEGEEERKDTIYTLEGTAAHELAELKLRKNFNLTLNLKAVTDEVIEAFKNSCDYYDQEMDEATDLYVELVTERVNSYEEADLELEKQVNFSGWVPGGFGTSDVVILSGGVIEIIDLKYGKGLPVYAYQNPQMMLYALGAYASYDMLYDFEKVRMTIIQPRLDNVSTFEVYTDELLYWADNYLVPRAVQAMEGTGEWDLSSDVLKFSGIRGQLVPRAAKHFELLSKFDYKVPELLEDSEIGEILTQKSEIEKWLKDVEGYALSAMLKGREVSGFKLVEGRSNRTIVDEEKAVLALADAGYEDVYKPRELKTITALEKLTGKKALAEILGDLIVKPAGKPTIAPISDKRPALNDAVADFE